MGREIQNGYGHLRDYPSTLHWLVADHYHLGRDAITERDITMHLLAIIILIIFVFELDKIGCD